MRRLNLLLLGSTCMNKKNIIYLILGILLLPIVLADPIISDEWIQSSESSAVVYWMTNEATHSYVEYDTSPCDGIIDNSELFNAIADWYNNQLTISGLMQNIKIWKNG